MDSVFVRGGADIEVEKVCEEADIDGYSDASVIVSLEDLKEGVSYSRTKST